MDVLSEKEYLIVKAEQICKTVLRGEIDRQDMFVFAHFVKIYLEKKMQPTINEIRSGNNGKQQTTDTK